MRKLPSKVLIVLVSLIIGSGCSVKEDRTVCPCRLVLDFSEVDMSVIKFVDLLISTDGGFLLTDACGPDEFRNGLIYSVPRDLLNVGAWSGADGLVTVGGMDIPLGDDCPPVYFHTSVVDTECEVADERIHMRKNHCRMTVKLGEDGGESWIISLFGNVDGYLPDGTPSSGDFHYDMRFEGDGYHAVLPRQTDDSLVMEIDDGSGIMKRFALGEYIAESGYDWHAPDLDDITVEINASFTGLTLTIVGWNGNYSYDVVI